MAKKTQSVSPKTRARLDKALRMTRNLCERFNANREAAESVHVGVFFSQENLGGLHLGEEEANAYHACLEALLAVQAARTDERRVSRETVQKALDGTLLRVLQPSSRALPARATFDARLSLELDGLQREMLATSVPWTVFTPVEGVAKAELPARFGGVTFRVATPRVCSRLARVWTSEGSEQLVLNFRAAFEGRTLMFLNVTAPDRKQAYARALRDARRVVDVMNFFAPFLATGGERPRVFLAPSGRAVSQVLGCASASNTGLCIEASRPPGSDEMRGLRSQRAQLAEIGALRASRLLASARPMEMDQRILSALAWAGRANAEVLPEEAFLRRMIALESLVTKATPTPGVARRVRSRVAAILTLDRVRYDRTCNRMQELYSLRSELVHSGGVRPITDKDSDELRLLVYKTLTAFLTDARFKSVRTSHQFERWCDRHVPRDAVAS